MNDPIMIRERLGSGGTAGHVCLPDIMCGEADAFMGAVQLAIIDKPMAAHSALQWKAGADDWLNNRSSLRFSIHHSRCEGQEEYLSALRDSLFRARELLSDTGSAYVFADQRVSAQVRLLCDEVFGRSNFLNEIIWGHGGGLKPSRNYTRSHDTIFLYSKGRRAYFNTGAAGRVRGRVPTNHMKRGVDSAGRVYFSRIKAGRDYRYYEDDIVSIGDVWCDIDDLTAKDAERTGWEGQRPEALIKRMVLASSQPGSIVLDMFPGAGTVAAVAQKAGRKALVAAGNSFERLFFRRRLLSAGAMSYEIAHPLQSEPMNHVAKVAFTAEAAHLEHHAGEASHGTLLDDGGTLECWLAGRLHDGVFHVHSWSMRTRSNPMLQFSLQLQEGSGAPCALLCDSSAQQSCVTEG